MSSKTDSADGRWTLAVIATLCVAAALRFAGLNSGLWYDEIVTLVESARLPVSRIISEYPALNVHPLYSLLAHGSLQAFGESAWALRLPACLFGIASVAMAFVLGERLTNRSEAWAGAAVLATSYHHVWFSQNARGYTLIGFFSLLSTFFLLRALETGKVQDYVFFAVSCAAGVYTHLTMVFAVLGQACALAAAYLVGWRPRRRSSIGQAVWAFIGAGVLSVALYAPFVNSILASMSANDPQEAAKVATASWAVGEAIRSLLSGAGVPAAIVGAALAAVGAISLARHHPLAVALLTGPGAITGVGILVLRQPLRPRFFFFLSGAAAIFVGRGIGAVVETIRESRPRAFATAAHGIVAVALVLVAASAVALPQNYRTPKQDFDGAVRFLDRSEAAGARITSSGPACWPFANYYGKQWSCLESVRDLTVATAGQGRVLVAYTLSDHIEDPELRGLLRSQCPIVTRFAGTLGQGDIIVCEVPRGTP